MRCESVQKSLPAFVGNSLAGSEIKTIQEHLHTCSECQGSLAKTRKLRSLLALKRHEKPDEFFLRSFVPEFHRRLSAEIVRKPTFWTRCREAFSLDNTPAYLCLRVFRYASVAVAALVFYTAYLSYKQPSSTLVSGQKQEVEFSKQASSTDGVVEVASHRSQLVFENRGADSVYVLDRLNYDNSTHGPIVLTF
jgi:hypothetical protein